MSIFKRTTKSRSSESFELPLLHGTGNPELEAKLDLELRICPTCSYHITNPMNDRCPRCFTLVKPSEHTNCGECSHQGNCTYQKS